MPNTQFNEVIKDPEFWKLGQEAQIKVLEKVDNDFYLHSYDAKKIIITKLNSQYKAVPIKQPSAITPTSRETARVGGGVVGGLVAATGGPLTWWTAPLAVSLGAGAGDAYYQLGQHISGDPNAPKTSLEAAKGIGYAGAREGAYELGGGLATRGAMKVLAPFAKKVLPEAKDATKILKGKIKPMLLASEATESRVFDVLENITEGSILGGGKISKFKLERADVLEDIADDLIIQFGVKTSPDELGDLFVGIIEKKQLAHKRVANVLYNNVKELTEGSQISTQSLKDFAKPISEVGEELGGLEAKNAGDDLIADVLGLPDTINYEAAQELRSRLISKVDEFNIINKKAPALGKAKKFIQLIDKEIEEGLPEEALMAWRNANRFYKEGQERFNNVFIRRLLKHADDTGQGPHLIGKTVVKPNAIKNIQKIRTALNDEEFKIFQSFTVQDLFKKSLDSETHIISGKKLLNNLLYKPTGLGEDTLKTLFTREQINGLVKFAKTLEMTQAKPGGLGHMWIQLVQGSAAASVGATGLSMDSDAMKGSAAIILFGPAILSRMMISPRAIHWLTRGIQLPRSSPEVIGLMARLVEYARRINIKEASND